VDKILARSVDLPSLWALKLYISQPNAVDLDFYDLFWPTHNLLMFLQVSQKLDERAFDFFIKGADKITNLNERALTYLQLLRLAPTVDCVLLKKVLALTDALIQQNDRYYVPNLFVALIDKGCALKEALDAAKELLKVNITYADEILGALVSKNYEFEGIDIVAQDFLKLGRTDLPANFWKALIKQGLMLKEALSAAKEMLKSNSLYPSHAVKILGELANKGYATDEIVTIVQGIVSSKMNDLNQIAFQNELFATISKFPAKDRDKCLIEFLTKIDVVMRKRFIFRTYYYNNLKESELRKLNAIINSINFVSPDILDKTTSACAAVFARRWLILSPNPSWTMVDYALLIISALINKMSTEDLQKPENRKYCDRMLTVLTGSAYYQATEGINLLAWDKLLSCSIGFKEAIYSIKKQRQRGHVEGAENLLNSLEKYRAGDAEVVKLRALLGPAD
ncbi:MAG: hypothetical protein US49_C0012G0027, partial [candidate division TM6 bacterium GW2011_GWF2_37_49]